MTKKNRTLSILSIAGSDNSCGAGIQADIKTAHSLKSYCLTVVTCITSQNSKEVSKVFSLPIKIVLSQVKTILKDFYIDAVKIGLITDHKIALPLSKILSRINVPIIVDPIYKSSIGKKFIKKEHFIHTHKVLSKIAKIYTPNFQEGLILAQLNNGNISKNELVEKIFRDYKTPIVLTGGDDNDKYSRDILINNFGLKEYKSRKISSHNTHGTGCSFSTALSIYLAKGLDINDSIFKAKKYVEKGIKKSPFLNLEYGPIGH